MCVLSVEERGWLPRRELPSTAVVKNSPYDEQQRLVTEKLLSAQLGRLYLLAAGAAQSREAGLGEWSAEPAPEG